MSNNKREILERVLLLMKYDNKITLTENLELVSEQNKPSLNNVNFASPNEYKKYTEKNKSEEWVPQLKTIKPFFGESLEIPKSSETVIGWPGYEKFKEDKNYPIQGADEYGPWLFGWKLKELPYYSKYAKEIPDDAKIHFPSTGAMQNLFNGAVFQFTIPKGTNVPFDEYVKENEDDWLSDRKQGEKPLTKDITFKAIKILKKDSVNQSIVPIDKNGMNGWQFYPAYYTSDLEEGKYVSYVPELWIQYKSPFKLWWDEYGLWIELVGSVLISILASAMAPAILGAIGATSISVGTMSFYADLILNGIFNLSIAKMNFDFHDDQQGWFSIIFSFLPLIHRFGGSAIKSVFKGMSEDMIRSAAQEVLDKSANIVLDSPQQWKAWYSSLSKETRKVIKATSEIEKSQVEASMKTILNDANKKIMEQKLKNPKWFIQSSITSGAKGLVKLIGVMTIDYVIIESLFKTIQSVLGKKLTNEEKVNIISYAVNNYDSNDVNNAIKMLEDKIESGEMTKEEVIQITGMKAIPETQVDSIVNVLKQQDENFVSLFD